MPAPVPNFANRALPMIKFSELNKWFGANHVLQNITLEVAVTTARVYRESERDPTDNREVQRAAVVRAVALRDDGQDNRHSREIVGM